LSQDALAIRAGVTRSAVAEIETGQRSPTVQALNDLLQLLGEELVVGSEGRKTGIDLTLNQFNLELSPEQRIRRGLEFADVVRQNRGGGANGLGRSLQLGPLLKPLEKNGVDFVVIGSIAGLVYGSAYPTYDLDVMLASGSANLERLLLALDALDLQWDVGLLGEKKVLSFDTDFGTLDILREVGGIRTYEELRRGAHGELIAGVAVQVASLDHLIAMKRVSVRRKDQLTLMEYVELADEIRRREPSRPAPGPVSRPVPSAPCRSFRRCRAR
jgi:transcriptional regulator with XRE-family HTH domain